MRSVAIKNDFQKLFDVYVAFYRARDAVGCASIFTPQAQLFSPYGPPLLGRAAIEAAHQVWVAAGGENKQMTAMEAGHSGDLGWCLAHYSEGTTGNGASLNVAERQPDGNWLIRLCSLNEAL